MRDNATKFAEVVLKLQRNETLFHQAQARGLAHARKMFTMATQAEAICTALGCTGAECQSASCSLRTSQQVGSG